MAFSYSPSAPHAWHWIRFRGPDAEDFLHRISTVNVRALQPGQGAPGCLLSAQGRIRAYFHLWCLASGEYAFEVPGGKDDHWKKELLTAIDQYTFAEKVQLEETTLATRWILTESVTDLSGALAGLEPWQLTEANSVAIARHADEQFGRIWISLWGEPASLEQVLAASAPGAQSIREEELEQLRIAALRPEVDQEITEQSNPLELGLVDAIAQNKGCYPGQEVIERIIALGSPARRLSLATGSGAAPTPGTKILNLAEPPAEVGVVTSAANLPNGRFEVLGMMKKIHAKEGLEVRFADGTQARIDRVANYA
jgi:folate-binding protein YgfZ